ncbi:hypothetical protein DAPK24_015180 [Pichia kluyveri]|uniref:Uncharacterized protein n=1 Tax=Pichia kluyveri TaxID=36015 RepID=A0AAV5R086_PICKL|nr:hypothetical protein DAPK24_015180 [Pichia kluyveri]
MQLDNYSFLDSIDLLSFNTDNNCTLDNNDINDVNDVNIHLLDNINQRPNFHLNELSLNSPIALSLNHLNDTNNDIKSDSIDNIEKSSSPFSSSASSVYSSSSTATTNTNNTNNTTDNTPKYVNTKDINNLSHAYISNYLNNSNNLSNLNTITTTDPTTTSNTYTKIKSPTLKSQLKNDYNFNHDHNYNYEYDYNNTALKNLMQNINPLTYNLDVELQNDLILTENDEIEADDDNEEIDDIDNLNDLTNLNNDLKLNLSHQKKDNPVIKKNNSKFTMNTESSSSATTTTTSSTPMNTNDEEINSFYDSNNDESIEEHKNSFIILQGNKKISDSRLSLAQLSIVLNLKGNDEETAKREKNILEILKNDLNFPIGEKTWIRDTPLIEREKIINKLTDLVELKFNYGYNKKILSIIVRRASYYMMQGRLRRERRLKRKKAKINKNNTLH